MKHTFPLCFSQDAHAVYWDHIKSNKTQWIMAAMAAKFEQEAKRPVHFAIEERKRKRLGGIAPTPEVAQELPAPPPPVVESPAAPPKAPVRHALWLPTSEEIEAGFYIVKPETFAAMDGGSWHFIQVEPGAAYPFQDGWTGQRVKWKPAETLGPFTPNAGVLEAALAADAARVAAILARR